jgi:hypothetical protein
MGKILLYVAAGVLVVLIGATTYLAFFDIPVQTTKVEKVLPDGRFAK